jgi:hypothetical protein
LNIGGDFTNLIFESPAIPFRFDPGDQIGVFISDSFCESASLSNPMVTIEYANV